MDTLLKISVVLLVGMLGGKAARIFKLPNVTGYLIAGLFIGPSFSSVISSQDVQTYGVISELALGAIAFSIGSEFILREVLKVGKSILVITLAEVLGAIIFVFLLVFFVFHQPFAFSVVIASMSAATAPAATLMVIKQFQAHGPLTKTILPVVALDDILGIIAFGIAMAIAKISVGATGYSLAQMITHPVIEIGGSILLGIIIGATLTFVANKVSDKEQLLAMVLAAIGGAIGLAKIFNFSTLLACIAVGTTLVNLMPDSKRVFASISDFVSPVYLLFFTLAGASLDVNILSQVGLLGIGYISARFLGKLVGARMGAIAVQAEDTVVRYLGFSLLAQGGISIGLSMLVRQQLPQYSMAITTVIMFSVLVFEVTGPIFAKIAIQKAGEMTMEDNITIRDKAEEFAY